MSVIGGAGQYITGLDPVYTGGVYVVGVNANLHIHVFVCQKESEILTITF